MFARALYLIYVWKLFKPNRCFWHSYCYYYLSDERRQSVKTTILLSSSEKEYEQSEWNIHILRCECVRCCGRERRRLSAAKFHSIVNTQITEKPKSIPVDSGAKGQRYGHCTIAPFLVPLSLQCGPHTCIYLCSAKASLLIAYSHSRNAHTHTIQPPFHFGIERLNRIEHERRIRL